MSIHAVLLAGGRGTRFWPASREVLPKQFLEVGASESLLARTGRRLAKVASPLDAWIVTNAAHVELAARQLPLYPRARVVGEPAGRNTAPCIALAAALVEREEPDGVLLVAPADHWIGDENSFAEVMTAGAEVARTSRMLVTFGVVPTSPATGYGYIEAGEELAGHERVARRVVRFTEKPNRATAEQFLTSGRHTWNSGIFAWRADVFLEELGRLEPGMVESVRRIAAAPNLDEALRASYGWLRSISVDYAVLERSARVAVVAAKFPWSDVGSWDALAELTPPDGAGNSFSGDILAAGAQGCFARSDRTLTALVGVRDLIVVSTKDAVLVCAKGHAQEVKKIVEELEAQGRRELL
ncbi:MAG: mannose-1-phosphate guanylyltransferase [bacterium]